MNYYEHHIGDYDEATSHLTACEDGIYSRLIRKYMAKEQPLPNDLPALQRLVRARTREEKKAVATVLSEFFVLMDDGWHQHTCDEAIEKFRAGEPEREVKKANEDNRLKRHREERSRLFKVLTDAGEHAPWNIGMGELREMVARLTATAPVAQMPPLPETAPATPATATQAPLPTTHTPEEKQQHNHDSQSRAAEPDGPTERHIQVSVLLRSLGVKPMTGAHPLAMEFAKTGATDEQLRAAVEIARQRKPEPETIAPAYLQPILADVLKPREPRRSTIAWWATNETMSAKARELGIREASPGEQPHAFKARIQQAIDAQGRAAA